VEAVAAQFLLFFDQEGLGPELGRPRRDGETRGTAADDADVEVMSRHEHLSAV